MKKKVNYLIRAKNHLIAIQIFDIMIVSEFKITNKNCKFHLEIKRKALAENSVKYFSTFVANKLSEKSYLY